MDSEEQVGGGSNGDLSQQREGSREDHLMFNHGRLQSPEQDESSMFLEQDHGSRSASPDAQSDSYEEDDIHNDHQQAGANQGSDELGSAEGSSGADEDELSDDQIFRTIRQELDQDMAKDVVWKNDIDEPDDVPSQGPPSSGCGSCKTLEKRLSRREKVIEDKCNIIKSKNMRLRALLNNIEALQKKFKEDAEKKALVDRIKALEVKLKKEKQKRRRLEGILRRHGIDPEDGQRFRSVPNPNTSTRAAPVFWKGNLREFYSRHDIDIDIDIDIDMEAWKQVWKAQYKQGNIPVNLTLLHPDIRLKGPKDLQDDDSVTSGDHNVPYASTSFTPLPIQAGFEGFNKLPATILLKILDKALFFSGRVVHIFSRLDPYEPPADLDTAEQLPGRIYISNGVNRKWNYFGAHIFYGKNTFAFSSFGEFGRFCKGIGDARLQRIAHLELHWQGGSCVRFAEADEDHDPRNSKDYRSIPLTCLVDMKRLDTLVIHIDESPTRRPLEASHLIQFAQEATAQQPNYRLKRALRACRGWDYLHMLRNMSWIRIYDTARMHAGYKRQKSAVRDISAVMDLNRTARMRNTPEKAAKCRLASLLPLISHVQGKWSPGEDDHRLVLSVLDRPHLEDNDLDGDYGSESESGDESSSSDSSADESSEDEDEDENEDVPQCQTAAAGASVAHESGPPDLPSGERRGEDVIVIDDDDDAETEEGRGVTHMSAPPNLPSTERGEVIVIEDSQDSETEEGRGLITHTSAPPELPSQEREREVIIIDDDDDSENESEATEVLRARSQNRRSTTSRVSSTMFVTPAPDEELSIASTMVSPDPTDLTKPVGIKRSAAYDAVETKRRRTKVEI